MAQKTAWNGATLTESDINTYLMGEGGAWSTWSPTLTQSGSVTRTVTHAVYGRWGRMIVGIFRLSVTGTGTGSNVVTVSLPVTAARADMVVGTGFVFDASASAQHQGSCFLPTTTTLDLRSYGTTAAENRLGVATFTAALASSDILGGMFVYEAAS
jgi:hypothetical protein